MYRFVNAVQECLKLSSFLKPVWGSFAQNRQQTFLLLNRCTRNINMTGAIDKIDSPLFQSLLTPDLLRLASVFNKRSYELRIVGGAVRDLLLAIEAQDVDISTTATPQQMVELFAENRIRYFETGLQHGTLTVHTSEKDYEVTTLRVDAETDGRHARVEFTNDWRLDAERRDLTFNAMSLALDGTLYDYFGGRDDLKNRRVRFVGDPRCRIQEDYLRILRYFRFYGRIAENPNCHDSETLKVISDCVGGLDRIAVERIWVEVSKILVGNHAPSLLRYIYNLKVANHIGLPSYSEEGLKEFERAWNEHQKSKVQPATLLFSLVTGTEQAEMLAKQWKLSNSEKALGKFIVAHREPIPHQHPLKPYQDMLLVCTIPKTVSIVRGHITDLLNYQGRHELADQMATWVPPVFPLTGVDLKHAGIKPGPHFGRVLNQLKEVWKDSYYTATKEDLLEKLEQLCKG